MSKYEDYKEEVGYAVDSMIEERREALQKLDGGEKELRLSIGKLIADIRFIKKTEDTEDGSTRDKIMSMAEELKVMEGKYLKERTVNEEARGLLEREIHALETIIIDFE